MSNRKHYYELWKQQFPMLVDAIWCCCIKKI
jgi:hypothetical protein